MTNYSYTRGENGEIISVTLYDVVESASVKAITNYVKSLLKSLEKEAEK